MSRLTGNDAKGLMEAYSAVYAPQELTEEQVWEEVENWVNSLLEEGYDLSEYTWEEMYEEYLSEIYQTKPLPTTTQQQSGTRKALESGKVLSVASNLGGLRSGTTVKMDSAATKAGGKTVLRATTQQGADAPEKSIKLGGSSYDRLTTKDGVRYIERKTPTRASDPKPDPKPDPKLDQTRTRVSPPPAATTPKVAPTKPALGPTGKPLVGGIERRTPTRAEMGAAKAYRTPAATTGTLGAATAAASKPAAFGSTSTAPEIKAAAKTTPAPVAPKAPTAGRDQMLQRNLRNGMEYDAYDLVLEYLLSQGHAETVEEAHYVMLEMDAETIGTIVEAAADQSDKQIDKGVKTTYKAQNVLDNQHQGRSKGLNKLPAGERASKTKRMQGRLKTRRDDLFGERNKREDSRRDELKKMLGL